MPAEPWYFAERAEQLATMILTRNREVLIERRPHSKAGIDLLVTLRDRNVQGRLFGVEVKGTPKISLVIDANHVLRRSAKLAPEAVVDYPFPVLLMLFDMSTDAGFAGWLLEPTIRARHASLHRPPQVAVVPVNDDFMRQALDTVRRWYDVRRAMPQR